MPALRQTAVADDMDIPDDLFASLPTPDGPSVGAGATPPPPPPIPVARHAQPTIEAHPFTTPTLAQEAVDAEMALLATLPNLPSILGLADRLATIQTQLDEARVEAEALRQELRGRADTLRALATALESI